MRKVLQNIFSKHLAVIFIILVKGKALSFSNSYHSYPIEWINIPRPPFLH
ncbi:MAG: hypothetical protein AMXMBFR79_19450 [Chitinophagaceae bacterium]